MSGLDAEELFHLGLHALRNDDPEKAISCLKECLERDPADAKSTYLLGATYAQMGMYDRAKQMLDQAIVLNPREYTAIFQLGLLHLTSGDVQQSKIVWQHLDVLGSDHFLYLFKSAMLALVADDFALCIALVDAGIEANTSNEALNNDMRKIKESAAAATAHASEPVEGSAVSHVALSGYQQVRDKK